MNTLTEDAENEISTHELYAAISRLSPEKQQAVRDKVTRIKAIIAEDPSTGKPAFGVVGLELTNICVIDVPLQNLKPH